MKSEIKRKIIRRLKILEGQIRGLQEMIDNEQYCIDILQQSMAAKQALSGVENLMFENIPAKFDSEYSSSSDTALKDQFSSYMSAIATKAATLAATASYPTGLQINGYSGFILPEGMTLPSGTKLGSSPMGASFVPSYYADKLPSGAKFGSGFVLPSGFTLPSSLEMLS